MPSADGHSASAGTSCPDGHQSNGSKVETYRLKPAPVEPGVAPVSAILPEKRAELVVAAASARRN